MDLTTHYYEQFKSLYEINGVPAIIYVDQPVADVFQVRYAYGTKAEPDDATDWVSTMATNNSASGQHFRPGQLLADGPYPCFSFWHSLTEQVCFATATVDPPVDPSSWLFTPLTESSACGTYSSWAWWQDRPLVTHSGAIFDDLVVSCCTGTYPPSTLLDWQSQIADPDSAGISAVSMLPIPGGIGITYRDAVGDGSLMYAWFSGTLPGGPGDWCVMRVDNHAGAMGANALALTADNRPAILYGDPVDGEIRVAVMDP
ncbi:hypothetical protein JW859_06500 [bacterium]|nr:hypothetical protein [bacterium]